MTRVVGVSLAERRAAVSHANAAHTWKVREGVVITLRSSDAAGSGEASPLPGYSRDDLATCRMELGRAAGLLSNLELPSDVHSAMRTAVECARVEAPAAIFAVETAVLDLIARARRAPAWALLRGDRDATPIALSALAEGGADDDLVRSAETAVARGIATVKIKIGGRDNDARDRARLARLRERLGDRVALRLDANQTFTAEEAVGRLAGLAPFSPELIEEPTQTTAWTSLPRVAVPLAMDESLADDGWLARLETCAARGTCAAIVLKPTALGGILRCLELARVAARIGVAVIVTHTFDGPTASAAAACVALAIRGRVWPCGLDVHGRLEHSIAAVDATHVVPFTAPGIGASE